MVLQEEMCKRPQFMVIYPIQCLSFDPTVPTCLFEAQRRCILQKPLGWVLGQYSGQFGAWLFG